MDVHELNEFLLDYFGDYEIMNLGEIIRYNNRAKIRKENVSEHTFYVATNVIKICSIFCIDEYTKLKALEMAITHDIPEIFLGDVPYLTKRDNPEVEEALEKAEKQQLLEHMPEFYESYIAYVDGLKNLELAPIIVKLADVISVLQYSNNEIELGNRSKSMRDINEDAKIRVLKLIKILNEQNKKTKNTYKW